VTALRRWPGVQPGLASWPFTPIEELDLYLENVAEPSLIQLEIPVRGHLDSGVLDSALADVLAADPTARRHLAATSPWHRRPRWESGEAVHPAGTAAGGRSARAREAGLLTVAGWQTASQQTALRERLSAWPIPLRDCAVRLISIYLQSEQFRKYTSSAVPTAAVRIIISGGLTHQDACDVNEAIGKRTNYRAALEHQRSAAAAQR